jgi:hypothetical protein
MLEIIILVKVFQEVTAAMKNQAKPYRTSYSVSEKFLGLSKRWNMFLLTLALAISVPPWNALIHGTHVVMAHAMGSELAIDSYILLGVFAFLLASIFPKREVSEEVIQGPVVQNAVGTINGFLMALVTLLLISGFTTGVQRYLARPKPAWLDVFPYLLVILGIGLAWSLVRLIATWAPLFLRPDAYKEWGTSVPDSEPVRQDL